MPDELRQCNFDRRNRRGGSQASPFRQNIRNIHRPSPSFWPAVIVGFFATAHAQFAESAKRPRKELLAGLFVLGRRSVNLELD